jgi:nicotinamide mononucleotide (NMN) deamidase PncC
MLKTEKTQYYNLIRFTRALVKIDKKQKTKILKLKEEILKTNPVVSKMWLLEKAEEKLSS